MAKDPYAILGIERSASQDDVKKAYRALSKEWHPDRHKGDKAAEEKFKEINQAYEILSDPEKRRMFDQFGARGGPGGSGGPGGMGGFDFSQFQGADFGSFGDIFESFFGGGRTQPQRDRGQDREVEISVPLARVVAPVEQTISTRTLRKCATCDGSGAQSGSSLVSCKGCGGTGQVTRTAQTIFGTVQQRAVCPQCQGSGKIPEKACGTCGGEGRNAEKTDVTVQIPAGIDDGQTLRVTGGGDAGRRGAPAGDLYVHVRVTPDDRFERSGPDIRSLLTVHALDAILGTERDVETVHGTVRVEVPEGTQPGQVLRVKGKGLPVLGSSRMGDHYVTVEVEIPAKISRAERKILEEWRAARG